MSIEALTWAFRCPVCGKTHEGQYYFAAKQEPVPGSVREHAAAFVCGQCAHIIANLYDMAHSGQCSAWPRESAAPSYVKQPISVKLRWRVFQRDEFRCVECGSQEDLTADHRDPERNGGRATLDNLQTMCRPCNSRKGAR